MVKFIQGIFISKDKRLRSTGTETKIFTEVHSSNLNEELGQINYIFSDKTGTLTKNIMEFKFLCVGEISYGDRRDLILEERNLKPMDKVDFLDRALFDDLNNQFSSNYKAVNEALLLLAVTHNIIIEEIDGEIIYNASSPDELSLVNFARFCGFMYKGIINNEIIINKTKYKFLHFLEFTSARKRSSIILENESNQVVLFCKGADSVIFERMIPSKYLNSTKNHLETYALVGLRTLVLAKRIIPRKEFEAWNNKYYEATICLANREKKMTDLQDEIEKELELVGATAIEDKLQDNVGDTIASLKEAGIQIWVLTGDKIETAINIGFSCKLLNDSLEKVLIDGKTKEEVANGLKQGLSKVTEKDSNQCFGNDLKGDFALVISGDSLIIITQDPDYCATMLAISDHCKAILACRVSPKQKGELVSLVRKEKPKITTLAIGDGANDVNMITAAHVGLGIKGVEGQQAARASDYAIGEFQLLRRLILYVGRESYRKNASLICYNFYKNMVLVLPLFWFAFFNGFSGQILYDPWLYQLFNVFYCSLPIILYALFDEEYPNNRVLDVFDGPGNFLETNPKFYAVGLKSLLFNTQVFWYWIMNGVFHSVILTAFTFLITSCNFTVSNGKDSDLDVIGEILYIGAVIFGNLKILIFSYVYFPFTVSLIFASVFFYVMNYYVINVIDVTMDSYGAFSKTFGVGIFYVLIILVIAFTMLTDLAVFRLSELGGEGEFDDDSSISFEEEEYEGEDNVSAMEMLEYPKKDYNGNNKSNSNDYSKNDNNKL